MHGLTSQLKTPPLKPQNTPPNPKSHVTFGQVWPHDVRVGVVHGKLNLNTLLNGLAFGFGVGAVEADQSEAHIHKKCIPAALSFVLVCVYMCVVVQGMATKANSQTNY